jgi:SAM-dependent methyltransferase
MNNPDALLDRLLYRFADRHAVAAVQRPYVRYFRSAGARRVLDIGCGRGIFLELLREAGIDAAGVDLNANAVAECQQNGFSDVEQGDAVHFLERRRREGTAYDGIFCSHVIEHMFPIEAIGLLDLCVAVLAPGGRFVLVTPNARNGRVWTETFWLDPTHVRPYPRRLIEGAFLELNLRIHASFDDRRTGTRYLGREFYCLIPDLIRFGYGTVKGMDSVVIGEKAP